MLGSGNANNVGGADPFPWFLNNTIRFNNISHTVGASSDSNKTVCVHGKGGTDCRDIVWGVYLDGAAAGIDVVGNIIGSTLHGAVFDNAGGNNTQTNNIFLADSDSLAMMDFGAQGGNNNPLPDGKPSSTEIAGNTVQRNIFYWTGNITHVLASQDPWGDGFLKPHRGKGCDHNLYYNPHLGAEGTAAARVFPGDSNLSVWQHLHIGTQLREEATEHDMHSIIADPLFVDPARGNFDLLPGSAALALGFQPIPPIVAPTARCGGRAGADCLAMVLGQD